MKKILVISSRVPYPLTAGFRIRIYNFSKYLSKEYKLDLLCLTEKKVDKICLDELKKVFNKVYIHKLPRWRCLLNLMRSVYNNKPLQVNYYYDKCVRDLISDNIKEYDLVICNHIRMSEYVKEYSKPKILDFHDAISLNYSRAKKEYRGIRKIIYGFEGKRVLNYEKNIADKFDKSIIVSEIDRKYLIGNGVNENTIDTIPVAVRDDIHVDNNIKEENIISFIGKMSYLPNEDAVVWFTNNVFPQLKKIYNDLKFYIIGVEPTKKVQELTKFQGVIVTGFVGNPYDIIKKSKIVVAPMRIGAGIQNKILEAMSIGKAVVTTTLGAEGIAGIDKKHFIVVNSKEEWIHSVSELLDNGELRNYIGKHAENLISQKYTCNSIVAKLVDEIEKII